MPRDRVGTRVAEGAASHQPPLHFEVAKIDRFIRLGSVTLLTFIVGCSATADADDPPADVNEANVPTVETDTVDPKLTCPLPKKRPTSCEVWVCTQGTLGCPPLCGCQM